MKATLLGLSIGAAALAAGCNNSNNNSATAVSAKHVLLISVDGMHQVDLANWIKSNPSSTFASLANTGVTYSAATTTTPSDSFPGLLSMVTGGTPKSTGVYYDDSYDRTLYAPGTNCSGSPGVEVVYDESIEFDDSKLFSGGINTNNLPLGKDSTGVCSPVYPHSFVKVNTIFEVVKAAGGLTAWSDKHAAYDLVNGPSGTGVTDLYTPEINSLIKNGGTANGVNLTATLALCDGTNSLPVGKVSDYTTCIPAGEAYDDVKVQAIVNQIDGLKSDGSAGSGVPEIFGMNFQQLSVGQKLPVGGYKDASGTPTANLNGVLAHVDQSIGKMVTELKSKGLLESTLIIISAKHGQSPIDPTLLSMESGGLGNATVEDPLDFIVKAVPQIGSPSSVFVNPNSGSALATNGRLQTDDVGLVWLQDQSAANISAVAAQLQNNAAAIFANTLPSGTIFTGSVTSGSALASIFGDPTSTDAVAAARAPNVFIQPNAGVIYSGSSKKIAEHGGGASTDTGVALLVSLPSIAPQLVSTPVTTTQIAPTILQTLGIDPGKLQAVQKEGTTVLPSLF
ncbi:MAG: type phosphodiesterase/nucleotide pyrophosphatase [Nevskia sp.]|nr:type phosphodiesterase/nucleotide pyrophosphatase [Nevskia sp.]